MHPVTYRMIEQIMNDGNLNCVRTEPNVERLALELKAIKKKMSVLPTARESEALPEIILLREFARRLLTDQSLVLRKEWQEEEKFERAFVEELFEQVCFDIIKARIYTNKEIVPTVDGLFCNLLAFATLQLDRQKPYYNSLINTIIDKSADYYKTNGKSSTMYAYPFGELLEPDDKIKKWVDSLEKGAVVDCLKTYAGKKNWSRAIIEARDNIIFRVRYVNDLHDTYIQNRYFEIAPLGTRETDFAWREQLKVGDFVDYYNFRSDWALYKIILISEEENSNGETVKTLEIQKEVKNPSPVKAAEQQGKSNNLFGPITYAPGLEAPEPNADGNYFRNTTGGYLQESLDQMSNQPISVKIHSPALAKPGKYSLKVGTLVDDSEDALFLASEKKQRFAIMRMNTVSGSSSIYFVKYINIFGENGGFDFILDVMDGKVEVNQEIMGQLVRMIQNSSENLVEPFIKANGEKILNSISSYILNNAERNLRNLSQQNLLNVIDSITNLAQRIYNSKRARHTSQVLVVRLAILCLKSDILEKQFFGAKQLHIMESRTREYDSDISRKSLAESLVSDNVFEKIVKGHPALISKGSGVLKLLLTEGKITDAQLSTLWDQICKTDSDSRASLLGMLKEILWEFSKEQIQFLVRKMLESASEINADTFDLLCSLRKIGWNKYNDTEVVDLVNDVFWEILQSEREMKNDLSKEVMQNFVKSIENESAHNFISRIVDNYLENRNKQRNLKLLRNIMKHSEPLCAHVIQIFKDKNVVEYCTEEIVSILRSKIRLENNRRQVVPRDNNSETTPVREGPVEDVKTDPLTIDEKFQIDLRLKLFKRLMKAEQADEELLQFKHFEQIWEIAFITANEEEFIHNWIKDYILAEKLTCFSEMFKQFFMRNYRKLLHSRKSDFFKFFVLIFHKINIIEGGFVKRRTKFETLGFISLTMNYKNVNILNKPVEKLFGIDALWELFEESTTSSLYSQLANYLTKIYLPPEFFENENVQLYTSETQNLSQKAISLFLEGDRLKAAKASLILMRIIKFEEKSGSSPLVSLASLKEGEKLVLQIEKDTKYLKEKTKISIYDNQTVNDLKELIAKEYRMSANSILLVKENDEEINSNENSLTLENANIRMRDTLLVREVEIPEVGEIGILNDNGTDFSEQTYKVFHEIFGDYSTDNKMTRENLAKFTSNATDGTYCTVTDDRVSSVFEKYDKDKKGFILERDLIDFYRIAAISGDMRLRTVRQNLQSLGYGKDLRLKKGHFASGQNLDQLLRFELCKHDSFNNHLYKYIEENNPDIDLTKTDDEPPIEVEPENQAQNSFQSETFYRLIELLSPYIGKVNQLLNDPKKILLSEKHPILWKYDLVILHALAFKKEVYVTVTKALKLEVTELQYRTMLHKIFEPAFIQSLSGSIDHINRLLGLNPALYDFLFPATRVLEKVFKVAIYPIDPELVTDMHNFLSFFIKQKKKINEKVQTESVSKIEKQEEKEKYDRSSNEKDKNKDDECATENEQIKQIILCLGDSDTQLSKLNYSEFNGLLIELMKGLNEVKTELSKFQKGVLRSVMIAFIASLRIREDQLPALLKIEQFQKLIFSGLAHEKGLMRLYYKNFYAFLTASSSDIRIKIDFLKILINNITTQTNEDFHSLVELACNILGEIGEMRAQNQSQSQALHKEFNFSELFSNFADKLLAHKSTETSFDEREDSLLIGYLTFMETILKVDELVLSKLNAVKKHVLVTFLFKNCLFEITNNGFAFQNIKCKSKKSRSAAICLLVQLLKNDISNILSLMNSSISPLAKNLPELQMQSYGLGSEFDRKSQLGFLGIKNLGCVCYMIAMLQQFYCTPAFRNGILMAEDKKPVVLTEVKGKSIDDNLFHQFQKMFSYLDRSERRDFTPLEFCYSYKDYTGQPVNVMVQQDADEFLKVIFDKLEDALKSGPYVGILNSVYGGKICNVIVCKGCGYEKVNEEGLYNLSLEVKNLQNLNDSFEKFIEEEIISEYMCDKCKNKCDISKKALLKALPNVLIVYLKKMVFDVDLLMNIKIHSKYEFPMEMNLKKYVHFNKDKEVENADDDDEQIVMGEDGQPIVLSKRLSEFKELPDTVNPEQAVPETNDDEYSYKLVGVVIHKGNAEYGHYTSLINVNRNDPSRSHIDKDTWLEFDDFRVSNFDMSHFQEECFGNTEEKDFTSNFMSAENYISKSAYILVYDKVKKSPIVFPFNNETLSMREKILSCLKDPTAVEITDDAIKTNFYNIKQTTPEVYAREIEKDNCALVLEQQLLSSSFTNSMAEIFSNIDISYTYDSNKLFIDEEMSLKRAYAEAVLQTLPNFLFKIYCVANDNFRIGKIVRTIENSLSFLSLTKTYGNNKEVAHKIDETIIQFYVVHVYNNLRFILNALITSNDQLVKNGLTDFIVISFGALVKAFQIRNFEVNLVTDIGPQASLAKSAELYLSNTLVFLLGYLPNPDVNPMQFRKLTHILIVLHKITEQNIPVLNHLLRINVLNTIFELYLSVDSSKTSQIERALSPLLSLVNAFLWQLLSSIKKKEDPNGNLETYVNSFYRIELFSKIFKEDFMFNGFESLKQLIITMATDNRAFSDQIIYVCLKGITSTSELDALGYLEGLRALLSIKDEFTSQRVKAVFGIPRLNEQIVRVNAKEKVFLYGLSKESSLKKAVYGYPSTFGLDRGLFEILFTSKDISENCALLIIYYILEYADAMPNVLAYIASVSPPNYLTAAYYDWFKGYVEYHIKSLSSAYSSYRPEITLLFFNSLPDKVETFEKKLRAYIESRNLTISANQRLFGRNTNIYSSYGSSSLLVNKEESDTVELFAFRQNYIIGKTNKVKLLFSSKIDEDEFGGLKIKFHLINVALLKSRPTGVTNLSIPQACLNYDSYVNKSAVNDKDFMKFFGIRDDYTYDGEQNENSELAPIFIDEEQQISGVKAKKPKELPSSEQELSDSSLFINRDYILRISMSNKTNDNYFVILNISGNECPNFVEEELTVPVRSRKSNFNIHNVTLKDVEKTFSGLKVAISVKKQENLNIKHFSSEDFTEFVEIFTFDDK